MPALPVGNRMVADLAAGMKNVFDYFKVDVTLNLGGFRSMPQESQDTLNRKLLRGPLGCKT